MLRRGGLELPFPLEMCCRTSEVRQEGARRREEMEAKSPFYQISVQTRDILSPDG